MAEQITARYIKKELAEKYDMPMDLVNCHHCKASDEPHWCDYYGVEIVHYDQTVCRFFKPKEGETNAQQ